MSHSNRYTADRQATQRRRISRLRPTIRFYSFCYFCPKISPRLMSRTADACYRAQSENDKEAPADAHSQRPLFQPFIRYQPALLSALLSRPSRVKCPLPDITVACPAKRAQRAFVSDSPWMRWTILSPERISSDIAGLPASRRILPGDRESGNYWPRKESKATPDVPPRRRSGRTIVHQCGDRESGRA